MTSPYPPGKPRLPGLERLRWRAVWLPSATVAGMLAVEGFTEYYLELPWRIDLTIHGLMIVVLTIGAYYFSRSVFGLVQQQQGEILRQARDLVSLEKRFRALLENSLDGVALLDTHGATLYASPSTTRISGYAVQDLANREIFEFIHPDDRGKARARFSQLIQEPGSFFTANYRMRHENGSWRWIEFVVINLLAEPSVEAIVCNYRDITARKLSEEEIRSLAKFPAENPNAVLRLAHDGRILYANEASGALMRDWGCTVGSAAPTPWRDAVREAIESGSQRSVDVQCGERTYSVFIAPIPESGYVNLYGTDITDRKKAELVVQAARVEAVNEKNRLEAVMEALPVGVAILDAQGGRVRSNPAFEQVWGGPCPPVRSVSDYAAYKAWWTDTGRPVQPEEWASARAVQKGEPVVGQSMQIERFDGTRAFVLNSAAPIRGADGSIAGSAVTTLDITERVKAEEKLLRAKKEWERTFDAVPDMIAILSDQHRILRANRAMAERLGLTPAQCVGQVCYKVVHGLGCPPSFCPHVLTLADERQHVIEVHEERLGGDFLVSTTPLTDDQGRLIGSVHVARDITERKQAEEALRKGNARLNLLADTASELLRSDSPQTVVRALCQKMLAFLDCHAFFNYLANDEKGCLHLNACGGIPEEEARKIEWLDYGVAVCGAAARDGRRIVAEDIPHTPDPRTELVKSFGIQAYACHPLLAQGRVLGTLAFGTRTRTHFTDDDLALMKAVAGQVALAMQRLRAKEALQRANEDLERRVAERTAELYEKSRFLEAFFHHSLDPVVFLDRHFNYIRVNEAYAKACQRDAAGFPGHNHFEFYPHAENQAIFENVVRTKQPFVVQAKPFTFPDHPEWGVTYWDWTLVPVLDANREVVFLVFSLRDVTQRERAEQEVRAASRYARSLIEASLDPLVTINPAGQITDANAATELVTGFSRQELIGTDFSDYFTEPEKARAGYQHVFREGAVRNYPLQLRQQNGHVIPVLYNASVYRGETGEVIGVFAAARDVSELRRAEEVIQESRARLAGIIGSALDAIITTDAEGRILFFNAAAEQTFRCPAVEAVGSPADRFIPERFRPAHREGMRAFGQTTRSKRTIGARGGITALRADGEEFPAEAAISQVEVGGQKFFTVILRDITMQKQAEAELRSSREQLRALAAHVESVREEERTRIAREIHDELGQQLTGLKIDLRWLTQRLPADGGALQKKAQDMGTLVDATIQSVRRLVTELRPGVLDDLGLVAAIEWQAQEFQARTDIACEFTSSLAQADLDPAQSTALFRILQEALTNIARHAQATRVGIHLEQTPEHLVLTVADKGRGITEAELDDRQAFGLLGMRERARSLGGRLTILGQPDHGTTVTVVIPPRRPGGAAP